MQIFFIVSIYFIESIITFWFATLLTRKTGSFKISLPLVLSSIALSIGTALFFYGLLLTYWHFVFTLLYIISIVMVLVTAAKKLVVNNENSL